MATQTSNSKSGKLKEMFLKIKSIKHIEIIIGIIAVALMILIFTGVTKKGTNAVNKGTSTEIVTAANFTGWEKQLSSVLAQIEGVGKTEVMITSKSTTEKVTANTTTTNSSSSTNSSGNTTTSTNTTQSPVIVNNNGKSEPYILKELMPEILGVIVVAQGADNAIVKLAIMRAVQTIFRVNASCIEIYSMK